MLGERAIGVIAGVDALSAFATVALSLLGVDNAGKRCVTAEA
jgi:hypothetical protein